MGIGICVLGVVLALVLSLPFIIGGIGTGDVAGEAVGVGVGIFAGGMALITTLPLGLIFAVVGHVFRKKAKKATWLRLHGVSAPGKVRSFSATGTRVNDVPVMRVEVEVMPEGRAPYVASFEQLLSGDLTRLLAAGNTIPLRVNPHEPRQIIIES